MSDTSIQIRPNGPFLVSGNISLTDPEGNSYDLGGKDTIALCRCGASANRPFCDGAHKACGFESAESAPQGE
jgi:CDGSH-type Zn-finger protein